MSKKLPSQRASAPSPTKARQILRDNSAQGHPLTQKQKGFFGALVGMGKKGK